MRKTIESLTPPEDKNVLWLDTSDKIKQLKCYNNGTWVIIGDDTENNEAIVNRVLEQVDSDFKSYVKKEDADNTYVSKNDMPSYQNKLIVGNAKTSTENEKASNGDVWLVETNDSEGISSAHNIIGSGAATVVSDASGNITIASTDVHPTELVVVQKQNASSLNIKLSNGNTVDATINSASTNNAGVMSSEDKTKLNSIAESATSDSPLSTEEIEKLLV